ncbi:MAG TPA: hypothetical protein PK079_08515 [Leptospiraceae bacterium]|nr:hypothetical protein [Leptospiraceae bacterium]HMW04360.1 hypothetical protein [Leptospiraceae bacterium]HMX31070.1 hypothetical protein [Leptospiraceae bacterium]HMY31886.1 hypothetical protein [Leptospiraceae bacterium]HMZ65244.1 hypothetical protein [Leptospiraceae bacterium]
MQKEDGRVYCTRNGNFRLDKNLELVSETNCKFFDRIRLLTGTSSLEVRKNIDIFISVDAGLDTNIINESYTLWIQQL